jgi:hypothetical protein
VDFAEEDQLHHQSFTIRQILEKCNEFQIETHHLFIEFRSAYDAIDRNNLHRSMEEMHITRKLIALVRATMRKTKQKQTPWPLVRT